LQSADDCIKPISKLDPLSFAKTCDRHSGLVEGLASIKKMIVDPNGLLSVHASPPRRDCAAHFFA
jgi:hypothetical protein